MPSRRAAAAAPVLLALLLALALVWGACSAQEPAGSERYARRFMLTGPQRWRLESTLPPLPQKAPQMVIWEVSQYPPGTQPTPEQRQAAADFAARCEDAAWEMGWEDFETAQRAGFTLLPGDRRHYYNQEYLLDDRILDPEHPDFLMYYEAPEGKRLLGYMFYVRSLAERGPQVGGPLTVWHYHAYNYTACMLRGVVPLGKTRSGPELSRCPEGYTPTHRSPEMLHVWLIDHPGGRFATSMSLDPARAQAELAKRLSGRAGARSLREGPDTRAATPTPPARAAERSQAAP